MFDLASANLALRSTRRHTHSARPDAPVVPPRDHSPRSTRVRARLATTLHRVASALEPREARPQVRTTPVCR